MAFRLRSLCSLRSTRTDSRGVGPRLGNSMRGGSVTLPHIRELVLGPQFFFLHVVQRGVVHRQHAQFRIADFAVEFLVALIKTAEFRVALHKNFDFFLLVLEHQPTSSLRKGERAQPTAAAMAARTFA